MNKEGIGKIEWCDYSYNPVSGCLYTCSFCYARKIATRFAGSKAFPNGFEPTFHLERLCEPSKLKKPSKIFVGSMCDLFGEWIDSKTIQMVIDIAAQNQQHTFMFLTKNPARYKEFQWPDNAWLGATAITYNATIKAQQCFADIPAKVKFLSFEPLISMVQKPDLSWLQWAIIGCMTGPSAKKYQPAYVDIRLIVDVADKYGIPVFIKDNCKSVWRIGDTAFPATKRQEWPSRITKSLSESLIDNIEIWQKLADSDIAEGTD